VLKQFSSTQSVGTAGLSKSPRAADLPEVAMLLHYSIAT
jgi:hypothetical protein